ncbi:hypothetical protein [Legionella jamestowniensis]|nr:hypothetical protein [Legionella jamestowniensis]
MMRAKLWVEDVEFLTGPDEFTADSYLCDNLPFAKYTGEKWKTINKKR